MAAVIKKAEPRWSALESFEEGARQLETQLANGSEAEQWLKVNAASEVALLLGLSR